MDISHRNKFVEPYLADNELVTYTNLTLASTFRFLTVLFNNLQTLVRMFTVFSKKWKSVESID